MCNRKTILKALAVLACMLMLSVSNVFADGICQGNFDYDDDVDAVDVTTFLNHYGRNQHNDPCPPDGPAPVERTGQTTCLAVNGSTIPCEGTGQDGEYQKGVEWPNPRFTDNEDGTVTDNLTGLMWTKDAQIFGGTMTTDDAIVACESLELAGFDDWRLPNVKELRSLIDYGTYNPALPSGHPFDDVPLSKAYYAVSTYEASVAHYKGAWVLDINHGSMWGCSPQASDHYPWPVRGGHN